MPDLLTAPAQSVQQMVDLVAGIVRPLADEPKHMRVESNVVDSEVVLRLFVTEGDLGKIIGKQGRTARSLRSILGAAASKLQLRCTLDIQSE